MRLLILFLLSVYVTCTPTMSPTANVSIPIGATLRPTTSTTTDVPTMGEMVTEVASSGEPPRVVTVAVNLVLCATLTVIGVFIISYGKDEKCEKPRKGLFKGSPTSNYKPLQLY